MRSMVEGIEVRGMPGACRGREIGRRRRPWGSTLSVFYPSTIRTSAHGSPPHKLRLQGGT
jgi:hypothetical protein